MRRPIASLLLLTLILTAQSVFGATPGHFWSKSFGSTGADGGYSIATDASGNVLVAGSFLGIVDFGGGNLSSAGAFDIFVAKYSPAGAHLWSRRFGGTGSDTGYSIATDDAGNVFVTGYFTGTGNFGGSNLVSAGLEDIFVAKYSPTGTHVWSKSFGSTGPDRGLSVATDLYGLVFVTGHFAGVVSLGGSNLVSAGLEDIFVAQYNSAGTHLWSKRFGSTAGDWGYSVATDDAGSVYATGYFQGTVNFGGGNLTSAGSEEIFVAKFFNGGAYAWSKRFGSPGTDLGISVAIDASRNVFVTGFFVSTVDFGGGNLVSAGGYDIFVAKYDAAGTHRWSQRFGSASSDRGLSVAADDAGNVFVVGAFAGVVDFGGGNLASAGLEDIFVAKYSPTGVHAWSQRFGSTAGDWGYSVATDAPGNVLVTGWFEGTVDFGGGNLVGAGDDEIFIAKYAGDPAEPLITSVVDIGNDQGRKVKIRFDRTGHDQAASPSQVLQYEAYRRDGAPPASDAWRGRSVMSARELLATGWTQVGVVAAHEEDSYGIDVPTIGDSTVTQGQYHSVFYIRAATSAPGTFFDSPIDSGYSLDNLAPGVPLNFVYDTGDLTWDESAAADFDFFTVYGSDTDSFGAATLVDYSVSPTMNVTASPYVYYFVTATDFSGNEGKPAKVSTISGVGGTPKHYVLSVSNYPNPFNPGTTVSYTVPSRGAVSISIYDTRGALVATLFNGDRSAGAYTIGWDGRAQGGATVSSGVYFARIEHASGTRSKKMVLLK